MKKQSRPGGLPDSDGGPAAAGLRLRVLLSLPLILIAACSGLDCGGTERDAAQVRAGRLELPGASLYYELRGEGPAIVFLHAGVADSRMWDPQVEAFYARFTTVRVDMRGFGRTRLDPGKFSDHGDVAALMDALGIETAAVVGASYGGLVAIDFALAHPDRVAALILAAPNVSGLDPNPDLIAFAESESRALDAGDIDAAVELNLRMWVDGPHRKPSAVDAALRDRVGEMQRKVFAMEFPEGVQPLDLDPPAAGRLASIACPTLVLIGALDQPAFVALAGWVAAQIPHASIETIPGVAHLPSLEDPATFDRLVGEFLAAN